MGWIREDLTVLVGTLDDVKRITTAELEMLPVAIANTALLNVRSGPDSTNSLVATLDEGDWVEIVGSNPQEDWVKVKYDTAGDRDGSTATWTYLAGPLSRSVDGHSKRNIDGYAGRHTTASRHYTTSGRSTARGRPRAVPSTQQLAANSVTVEVSLPSNGNIELEVSWIDSDTCTGCTHFTTAQTPTRAPTSLWRLRSSHQPPLPRV